MKKRAETHGTHETQLTAYGGCVNICWPSTPAQKRVHASNTRARSVFITPARTYIIARAQSIHNTTTPPPPDTRLNCFMLNVNTYVLNCNEVCAPELHDAYAGHHVLDQTTTGSSRSRSSSSAFAYPNTSYILSARWRISLYFPDPSSRLGTRMCQWYAHMRTQANL